MEGSSIGMDIDPPDIQSLSVDDFDDLSDHAATEPVSFSSNLPRLIEENGRGYVDGSYFLPGDQLEGTRQSILHQAFTHFLERKLMMAHLSSDKSLRILDVGTGFGDWALAVAAKFTSSIVIATDISSHVGDTASQGVPSNLHFQLDDARAVPWTFETSSFDFIHMRGLGGAFTEAEASSIYGEAFRCLKNGGILEVSDFGSMAIVERQNTIATSTSSTSKLNALSADAQSYLSIYNAAVTSAADARRLLGTIDLSHVSGPTLERSGFRIQRMVKAQVPLGEWSANRRDHRVGRMTSVAMLEGFEARAMRLLTKELGWSKEDVKELCDKVKEEVLMPRAQPMVQCHFVVARKLDT